MLKDQYKYNNCFCFSYDGKRIKWTANLELLKVFVDQIIELKGKCQWTSPGGNAKRFICDGSDTTLTWYPGKQNTLILHGKLSITLRNKLTEICRLAMNDASPNNTSNQSLEQCNARSPTQVTKSTIFCAEAQPVNEEKVSSSSPTFKDLEDFIDQSFQTEVLLCSVNDNKASLQITDNCTQIQASTIEKPAIITEDFCTFKRIEIELAALKEKIIEQGQIIYKNEQNICKLSNENMHLKSRIDELERRVASQDKSSIALNVIKNPCRSNNDTNPSTCIAPVEVGDHFEQSFKTNSQNNEEDKAANKINEEEVFKLTVQTCSQQCSDVENATVSNAYVRESNNQDKYEKPKKNPPIYNSTPHALPNKTKSTIKPNRESQRQLIPKAIAVAQKKTTPFSAN